jgi:hypothetical protein
MRPNAWLSALPKLLVHGWRVGVPSATVTTAMSGVTSATTMGASMVPLAGELQPTSRNNQARIGKLYAQVAPKNSTARATFVTAGQAVAVSGARSPSAPCGGARG